MKNPVFTPTKDFDINVASSSSSMRRMHYHDTFELFLVLEGRKTLLLGNKKYLLSKGSLFVVEPFVLHMTTAAEGEKCLRYIIELSQKALSPLLNEQECGHLFGGISTCVANLGNDELYFAHTLFKDAHQYKNSKDPLAGKLMVMTLTYLTDFIRRSKNGGSAIDLPRTGTQPEEPIMQALSYINLNYSKPITLDYISKYAHMSRSNFCLVFKKAVGDTFVNYVNSLRISQAHRLITTTDLPLFEIAARTGFSSVDYMTRIFKKVHGTAPAKLRRETAAQSD